MAAHPHSTVSAVVITTTTTAAALAANTKLSLLPHICHRRYDFSPTTPFITSHLIRNVSVDIHNQRRLLLRPPRAFSGDVSGHLVQDAGATLVVVAGAYALVSGFDNLTRRQIIEQSLSRKLVHILSGLLYMGCWPIFRELLRGPLYYVMMLILSTILFWRESPIGVVSLSMMCGGDGIADIMGRRFGTHKIPYNEHKSWAGSVSMFIVGFLISIGMLYYFSTFGYFELNWLLTIERVATVALVATLIESLPTKGGLDDNISVPLVSMVTAYLSFGVQP